MDRLTGRDSGTGSAYYLACFKAPCYGMVAEDEPEQCLGCEHAEAECERLAAYEDTGLTPAEVEAMKAELAEAQRYIYGEGDGAK